MNTKTDRTKGQGKPELPIQPGTADIDAALERQAQYNRKWHAIGQQAQHSPLPLALQRAKDALVGDSNDEEHDALVELIERAKEDEERIETLQAHAEALAEALRNALCFVPVEASNTMALAREALARWEAK